MIETRNSPGTLGEKSRVRFADTTTVNKLRNVSSIERIHPFGNRLCGN